MNTFKFFREGIRNLKTVGTLTRSSRSLCKRIVEEANFEDAKCIVELGAGDGVITGFLLEAIPADCKLIVFELNEKFCHILREIDDERLIVIEDDASKLSRYLEQYDLEKPDHIISAIPFVVVPKEAAIAILQSCKREMKKEGKYLQVHYSLLAKKLYEEVFDTIEIKFVIRNLPPAFLFVCGKL